MNDEQEKNAPQETQPEETAAPEPQTQNGAAPESPDAGTPETDLSDTAAPADETNANETASEEAPADETPGTAAKTAADYVRDARARVLEKKLRRFHKGKVAVTAAVVLCMTAAAFAIPLRPSVSLTEKRELAKFPAFRAAALLDGSFFSDVATWFSDTVPYRDLLTAANARVQHLLGTGGAQAGFNEGVQGDEIPDVPFPPENEDAATVPGTEPPSSAEAATTAAAQTTAAEGTGAETTGTAPDETASSPGETGTTASGSPEPGSSAPHFETLNSILICGNAGYEYYNFVQTTADSYIAAVNRAAEALGGKAQVYAMVIPTSIGVTLDPGVQAQISSSDQKKACAYLESQFSTSVKTVPIYGALCSHRDEYIYFRTDHHWTGLGAYYAYVEFCGKKGVRPVELNNCKKQSFDGFLGSFYSDTGRNPALGETPDVVETFLPPGESKMTVYDNSGKTLFRGSAIYNAETSIPAYKYGAFIFGDNPFSVIEDETKTDGGSCLLVKESFGNALAPMLTAVYKTVYVMDYRYCDKTVAQLVDQYGINDVIFANNISMTRSTDLVKQLAGKIN